MNHCKIIILAACVVMFTLSCKKENTETYKVQRGNFTQTITETGELAAVNVRAFVMQRYGRYWYEMKIIGLLDHGTAVEAGDSLIQLDPSEVQRFIIDRETRLETQKANLEKMTVEVQNRKSELQSSLKSEEATFALKKLELEQFRFESDKARKVKELEFEQAKIRLNKVKQNIEYYDIIAENQLYVQKIQVKRMNEEIKNAYDVLPQLTVRTPIPGIFQVARNRRSRDRLMIGDEVYVGRALGNVPDLTWIKGKTVVNETDFMKIYEGQPVNVRLDALPDVVFKGEITKISRLCRPIEWGSKRKVFDVEVKILVTDERLKPGMTVSCEFICSNLSNALFVPLQCVENIGKRYYIYLKDGNGFQKMEVKAGPANNTSMVIEANVKKGQELWTVNGVKNIDKE